MKLRCVFGHEWIYGRVADREVRQALPRWKVFHNRACSRCGKEDMAADNAEAEYDRLIRIKSGLGASSHAPGDIQSMLEEMDRPLDS